MTAWAAKWTACWDEPHCRSMVTPGTDSGKPAASSALRAMLKPCSPTWLTAPMMTSSTMPGSRSFRSTRARSGMAARSTAWMSLKTPLRRPIGVRTASTITAFRMVLLSAASLSSRPLNPPPERPRTGPVGLQVPRADAGGGGSVLRVEQAAAVHREAAAADAGVQLVAQQLEPADALLELVLPGPGDL